MKQIYVILLIVVFAHYTNAQVAKVNNTVGTVTNVPVSGAHLSRTFTYTAGEFTTTSLTEVEISIQLILGNGTPPAPGGYGVHEDLNVRLVSPSGTIVDLIQDRWGYWTGNSSQSHSFNGFNAVNATVNFNDDNSSNIQTLDNWQNGNYAPHNLLSGFDGENAAGTWTLHISDGNSQFAPTDYIQFVTATLTITSGAPLNIEENSIQDSIILYPNPTTNIFTIAGLNKTEGYTIYNILGKIIKKGAVSNNDNINVENLINGVYFIKFKTGASVKVVKQ